jgi:hypothetical protein
VRKRALALDDRLELSKKSGASSVSIHATLYVQVEAAWLAHKLVPRTTANPLSGLLTGNMPLVFNN